MELLTTYLRPRGPVLCGGVVEFDLGIGVVEVPGWSVAVAAGDGVEFGSAAGRAVYGGVVVGPVVGAAVDVHIFNVGVAALGPGDDVVDFAVDGGLIATVVDADAFGGHESDALFDVGGALGAAEVQWPAGVGVVDDEEIKFRSAQRKDVHRREFAVGVGGEPAGGGHFLNILYGHADRDRADTPVAFRLHLIVTQQNLVKRVDASLLESACVILRLHRAGVTRVAGWRQRRLQQC